MNPNAAAIMIKITRRCLRASCLTFCPVVRSSSDPAGLFAFPFLYSIWVEFGGISISMLLAVVLCYRWTRWTVNTDCFKFAKILQLMDDTNHTSHKKMRFATTCLFWWIRQIVMTDAVVWYLYFLLDLCCLWEVPRGRSMIEYPLTLQISNKKLIALFSRYARDVRGCSRIWRPVDKAWMLEQQINKFRSDWLKKIMNGTETHSMIQPDYSLGSFSTAPPRSHGWCPLTSHSFHSFNFTSTLSEGQKKGGPKLWVLYFGLWVAGPHNFPCCVGWVTLPWNTQHDPTSLLSFSTIQPRSHGWCRRTFHSFHSFSFISRLSGRRREGGQKKGFHSGPKRWILYFEL